MSRSMQEIEAPAVDEALASPVVEARRSPWWVGVAERYALFALFVIALVFFSSQADGFYTSGNFRVVLSSQAPLVIIAIAAMLPLLVGQFDLSIVAISGTCAVVVATSMSRFHQSLGVSIVLALVAGTLLGVINGVMVAKVGVNAFIVTLAMSTILQGAIQGYTNGSTINSGLSPDLTKASVGTLSGIPRGVIWFLPVAIVVWYVLEHTPYGRHLRSIGSNPNAARLIGLPVANLTISTFALGGFLSAIGGILLVGQSGLANPETALGALLLPALAAVFLGASTLRPGLFNVAGTVLAVFFVAFIVSGLSFMGADSWVEPVLDGAVLAGAVTITTFLRQHRRTG